MSYINPNLVRWLNGEALDESLEQHDKKYHGGQFDPETMSCGKRDKMAKGDDPKLGSKKNYKFGYSSYGFIAKQDPADYNEYKEMADYLEDEAEDNGGCEEPGYTEEDAEKAFEFLAKRFPEFEARRQRG